MSIRNPVMFIGEKIFNAVAGAPLFADANGQLITGDPNTTFVSGTTNITTTSTTYVTVTGMTLSPAVGTYHVWGRIGSAAHTTNNAQVFLAIAVAGTAVTSTISMGIPFIQGGVTPSLAEPWPMVTFGEITITSGQAITLAWRTSAGTAQANLSYSLMLMRIR